MMVDKVFLKNKYNPEGSTLRKAQIIMTGLLEFFDEFCKENRLVYWLDSGTLLGAARHKGFIPWDDDVDVMMPIKDFKRLKKLMIGAQFNKDIVLQCHETDSGYYENWAVLRDLKSEYIQDSIIHNRRSYRGVQIDIFPCTNLFLSPLLKFCRHYQNRLINKPLAEDGNTSRTPLSVRYFFNVFHFIIIPLCNIIGRPFTHDYVRFYYGIPFESKRYLRNIYPLRKIVFENKEFNAPQNTAAYLTDLYGDWQQIPDMNQIETHNVQIRFM